MSVGWSNTHWKKNLKWKHRKTSWWGNRQICFNVDITIVQYTSHECMSWVCMSLLNSISNLHFGLFISSWSVVVCRTNHGTHWGERTVACSGQYSDCMLTGPGQTDQPHSVLPSALRKQTGLIWLVSDRRRGVWTICDRVTPPNPVQRMYFPPLSTCPSTILTKREEIQFTMRIHSCHGRGIKH